MNRIQRRVLQPFKPVEVKDMTTIAIMYAEAAKRVDLPGLINTHGDISRDQLVRFAKDKLISIYEGMKEICELNKIKREVFMSKVLGVCFMQVVGILKMREHQCRMN